jgi:hypothetical protein
MITITGDAVFFAGIDISGCFGNNSIAKIIQKAGKLYEIKQEAALQYLKTSEN